MWWTGAGLALRGLVGGVLTTSPTPFVGCLRVEFRSTASPRIKHAPCYAPNFALVCIRAWQHEDDKGRNSKGLPVWFVEQESTALTIHCGMLAFDVMTSLVH